ncbi:hypothetical protein [Hymenobacter sp. UYP22]|uniref:hypothetical protein n=1 Tax=Hymenobacter sp. UYP22 TaxID=3156348 RepID=UPI003392AB19
MQRSSLRSSGSIFRRVLRPAVAPLALGLLAAGCTPHQSEPTPTAGTLDVYRYVAIGDGYTAGFSEGGLTATGQQYSFPNLLAQQFIRINPPATFTQGLLPAGTGTGYLTSQSSTGVGGKPLLYHTWLVRRGRAVRGSYVVNAAACGGPDTTFLYSQAASSPLSQNLGVPGLGLAQVEVAGLGNTANQARYGSFNSYFERLLPANDNRTYLQVATDASSSATFFTFFMGLGDALPYILSGGECGTPPNSSILTSNAKKMLDRLAANGRQGVIALTPSVQNLPLLQLGGKNGVRGQLIEGVNPDSIYVRSAPGNVVRAIDAGDFILPAGLDRLGAPENVTLPNGTTVSVRYGLSKRNPLVRRDVLDYFEFNRINTPLVTLNTELERLAKNVYKLPFVSLDDELFTQINRRISVNGVEYSSDIMRGNFYSLDMYSLTPRGNALLANTFIKAINGQYRANIPFIDPNTLPTTTRPQ